MEEMICRKIGNDLLTLSQTLTMSPTLTINKLIVVIVHFILFTVYVCTALLPRGVIKDNNYLK